MTITAATSPSPAAGKVAVPTKFPRLEIADDVAALGTRHVVELTTNSTVTDLKTKQVVKSEDKVQSFYAADITPLRATNLEAAVAAAGLLIQTSNEPAFMPDRSIAIIQSKSGAFYAGALRLDHWTGPMGGWIDTFVDTTKKQETVTSLKQATAFDPLVKAIVGVHRYVNFTDEKLFPTS